MKNIRPEIKLLLSCARTNLDSKTIENIKNTIKENINWEYLIPFARSNKVLPLLYRSLNLICPKSVPEVYLNQLKEHFHASSKSNLYLTGELCRILNLFEGNKIPVIPYKGPVLASYIYKNLALREFYDLDLLVHKKDIIKVRDLLLKEGYKPTNKMTSAIERVCLKYDYEYEFDRDDGVHLEVHWRVVPSYFSNPINQELLWKRLKQVFLGNKTLLTFSDEDLLLFLCINGAKHYWDTLSMICDVAELIGFNKDINWDWVIKQASICESLQMLLVGLFLSNDLLDAILPKEILNKANSNGVVKELAGGIKRKILNDIVISPTYKEICSFHLKIREGLLDKLRYIFYLMITPTLGDPQLLPLPRSLSFLYYLIRPFRLIGKYLLGLFGGKNFVVYDKTSEELIQDMLLLAKVSSKDIIYDLGCGDGRILIAAAKQYGVRGVGVDIEHKRIIEAKANACREKVEHLLTFKEQDLFKTDLSPATVITIYLNPAIPCKLKERFLKKLKTGTRIVSHWTYINNWTPAQTKIIADSSGFIHTLYLWQVEKESLISFEKTNKIVTSTK